MSKNASIHLTILIGNFGFKFFNKKYQNCSSACVLFYMSALCSGCLHYAPSSHSKAPHNHFKWSQMTTYSINFPSLYWLFLCCAKKQQQQQNSIRNQTMNAMELTDIATQHILLPSPEFMISLSLSDEVLKTLFHHHPSCSPTNLNILHLSCFQLSSPITIQILQNLSYCEPLQITKMSCCLCHPYCWSHNFKTSLQKIQATTHTDESPKWKFS